MTDEKTTMERNAYDPWDLGRIPGLNLMEYAKEVDRGGKKDLELSLEGRKIWFRLVCPGGGLALNALRVTDAMAIFEARVFADADDRNPLASFTATQKADKSKGEAYIRAAQETALNEALKNAGFSLRLWSMAPRGVKQEPMAPDAKAAEDGPERTQPVQETERSTAPVQADAPKQESKGNAPVPKPAADNAPRPAPVGPQPHAAPRPAPVGPQPHAAPPPEKEKPAPTVVNIGDARQAVAAENKPDEQVETDTQPGPEAAPAAAPAQEAPPAPAPVTYTPDMTVEEISQRMTLEQAQNVKVLDGTCKGWTLAQVAKDRPTSLRWLQSVCPFADNELKAAATIVLNDLELRKAG